jgi:plastocyanin
LGNPTEGGPVWFRGRPNIRLVYLCVACLVLMAGVACGSSDKGTPAATGAKKSAEASPSENGAEEEETSTKTIAGQQVNFKESADVGTESSIEVEADNFYFSPTVLTGKPGQTITLELKNEGSSEHNFTLESQHIDQDLETGESAKVKVSFPQSGTLLFHCKYHESIGMRGALQATS